ncbi:MAG: archease, partial [Candidatus Odinarchaeota archaeon]
EFLYIFDVEQLVFNDIKVHKIEKGQNKFQLVAKIKGEVFDKKKHEVGCEVKAITYSFMNIEEKKDCVKINIVFDI